jgi:hypothetical protein
MLERFSQFRRHVFSAVPSAPRRGGRLALLTTLVVVSAVVAACTPEFEGGQACPVLCPQEQAPFRDTIIDAVSLDSSLGPFPVLGVAGGALIAARGDTLQSYVVIRFDALPNTFNPNNEAVSEPITTIDSTFLRFVVDTSGTRADGDFTIEVFDVDTTESDSVAAVVQSLFRPDRKIGEVTIAQATREDSLRVPLSNAFVASRMVNQERLRLGVRIVPTANAQLRIGAFVAGEGAPRLTFDPASDTTYSPLDVTPFTSILGAESDNTFRLAYTVYSIATAPSEVLPPATLVMGGLPSRRAYFRFALPSEILDSSTVVRAELVLTQRPALGPDRGDSVGVQPFIGVSRNTVTDLYLATVLAANGLFAGVDSVRLVPQDSGEVAFNIVNVVRGWATQDTSITRFIALRMNGEGFSGTELRFHDQSGPVAQRPRLRITYLPRTEFALP